MQLRGKLRSGELKSGKLFREAAKLYLREFDNITQGQRSPTYARGQHVRAKGHLIPFFGSMVLPEITAGKVNEYRIHRLEECKAARGKPPTHNTMHQEIVTLRQIFKTALRHGWIDHLPDLSEHLKTRLDASAINIMRPRPKKKTISKKGPGRVEAVRLADEA